MGDNITLGPGALYINGQEFRTNGGLSQVYELEAEDETDQEAQNWPKVNPALEAEFTGTITLDEQALQYMADLVSTATQVLWDMARVAVAAYEKAPPRVRHLMLHARKQRARKKNIRRIYRVYKKEATD